MLNLKKISCIPDLRSSFNDVIKVFVLIRNYNLANHMISEALGCPTIQFQLSSSFNASQDLIIDIFLCQ